MFPPVRILAALGGLMLAVSVFLEWLTGGINALDIPFEALWSDTAVDGFGLGWVLLALGGPGLGLSLAGAASAVRRVLGLVGLVLAAWLIVRLITTVSDQGGSVSDALGVLGVGPWIATAGAVLLILGPAGRAPAGSPPRPAG